MSCVIDQGSSFTESAKGQRERKSPLCIGSAWTKRGAFDKSRIGNRAKRAAQNAEERESRLQQMSVTQHQRIANKTLEDRETRMQRASGSLASSSTWLSKNRYTHYYALYSHGQAWACPKPSPALSFLQWYWMHLYMYTYPWIPTWVPTNLILGNNDLAREGVFGIWDRMIHNANTTNDLNEQGCYLISIFTNTL